MIAEEEDQPPIDLKLFKHNKILCEIMDTMYGCGSELGEALENTIENMVAGVKGDDLYLPPDSTL